MLLPAVDDRANYLIIKKLLEVIWLNFHFRVGETEVQKGELSSDQAEILNSGLFISISLLFLYFTTLTIER